jgi:hypothetical protein
LQYSASTNYATAFPDQTRVAKKMFKRNKVEDETSRAKSEEMERKRE